MTTPANPPASASILNDIRFWAQITADARRTLICRPELADQVRAKLDQLGMAGLHDVLESCTAPAGQILIVDHNAIEASTRQAIQSMSSQRSLFPHTFRRWGGL